MRSLGLVHRGLTPGHILLSNGEPRILHIGSRRASASPAYRAPERFAGRYLPAGDVYALAAILLKVVFGDPRED